MSLPETKLAYTIAEFAKVSGVGRSFIYEEVKSGRLKLKKAGRRSLITAADAEAWITALPEQYVRPRRAPVRDR